MRAQQPVSPGMKLWRLLQVAVLIRSALMNVQLDLTSQGASDSSSQDRSNLQVKKWKPPTGTSLEDNCRGPETLGRSRANFAEGKVSTYVRFLDDFPCSLSPTYGQTSVDSSKPN